MEVDAAVGSGEGLGADLQLEVLEFSTVRLACVEEVAPTALGDEDPVLHREGFGQLGRGGPALEVLAVEQFDETFLGGGEGEARGQREEGEKGSFVHGRELCQSTGRGAMPKMRRGLVRRDR